MAGTTSLRGLPVTICSSAGLSPVCRPCGALFPGHPSSQCTRADNGGPGGSRCRGRRLACVRLSGSRPRKDTPCPPEWGYLSGAWKDWTCGVAGRLPQRPGAGLSCGGRFLNLQNPNVAYQGGPCWVASTRGGSVIDAASPLGRWLL